MTLTLRNIGFKQRIILTVVTLVAIALSISNWLSFNNFKTDKIASIEEQSRLIVDTAKLEVSMLMNKSAEALEATKGFYAGERSEIEYVEVSKLITKAAGYASFAVGYSDGKAYANIGGNNGVFDVRDFDPRTRIWYQEAMAKNRTILTDFYSDTVTGSLMVSVASPISGQKEGVVVGDISLASLDEMVSHVDFPGAVVLILSEDFSRLASTVPNDRLGSPLGLSDLEKVMTEQGTGAVDYYLDGSDKRAYFSEITLVDGNKWYLLVGVDKSIVYAAVDDAFEESLAISSIILFISLVVVYVVLNHLYRPITALKETVIDLSAGTGDLTHRLEVNSEDDLGQIAESVNIFIANLQQMMLEVSQATSHISASVEDLRQQSEQNANVLQAHVDETDHVVTAINEMSSTAENVSTNAADASSHIHGINDRAKESKTIVVDAVGSVSALVNDVELMGESISDMNIHITDIASVLKVIGEIADQTNLLALNAAIEAARAGAQGRGFAVVADEVRALAGRTQQSTSEIEQMLKKLTSGAGVLVNNMNVIKDSCHQTATNTEQVNVDLDQMANSINEVNNLAIEIATAAQQQSLVSEEISENMTSIRHMADTLAESGRLNLENSQTLATANTQLSAVVSKFKLN